MKNKLQVKTAADANQKQLKTQTSLNQFSVIMPWVMEYDRQCTKKLTCGFFSEPVFGCCFSSDFCRKIGPVYTALLRLRFLSQQIGCMGFVVRVHIV